MSEQNTAVITENHLKPAWLFMSVMGTCIYSRKCAVLSSIDKELSLYITTRI